MSTQVRGVGSEQLTRHDVVAVALGLLQGTGVAEASDERCTMAGPTTLLLICLSSRCQDSLYCNYCSSGHVQIYTARRTKPSLLRRGIELLATVTARGNNTAGFVL